MLLTLYNRNHLTGESEFLLHSKLYFHKGIFGRFIKCIVLNNIWTPTKVFTPSEFRLILYDFCFCILYLFCSDVDVIEFSLYFITKLSLFLIISPSCTYILYHNLTTNILWKEEHFLLRLRFSFFFWMHL